MTNREFYEKQILDIACSGGPIALTMDGNLVSCNKIRCCSECGFYNKYRSCKDNTIEWSNAEYKKPEIDWNKVPVDTPIFVDDRPRYFADYDDTSNAVDYYPLGRTSFSCNDLEMLSSTDADNVKLAREEDIEKYSK